MNQTAAATDVLDPEVADVANSAPEPSTHIPNPEAIPSEVSVTSEERASDEAFSAAAAASSSNAHGSDASSPNGATADTTPDATQNAEQPRMSNGGAPTPATQARATTARMAASEDDPTGERRQVDESSTSTETADSPTADLVDGTKKARAPRTPKAPAKPAEPGGSITTIVERVVRMTTLSDDHAAALARLFNVSLPEDYVARLTRLTGASLGPIGNGASEALTIVLGLESANPIHVGVQLGRLAATSLPDVYRCAHALTGEPAPALPKGDNAVFAVADVLATLTAEDFALARALSSALE